MRYPSTAGAALSALVVMWTLSSYASSAPVIHIDKEDGIRPPVSSSLLRSVAGPRIALLGGSAVIDVTAPSESVSVQAGQQLEDVMIVANQGGSVLDWTAACPDCEDDSGGKPHRWLTLEPDHALVQPNESVSVRVIYDTTGLPLGTYSGIIDVASNDPVTPDVFAPVDLNVSDSCEAQMRLSYPDAPSFLNIGDTFQVALALGAGRIGGGTQLRIDRIRFNLDCDHRYQGLNCADNGLAVSFQGSVSSDCGVSWLSSLEAGDLLPNQLELTPVTPLAIPAETAGFCTLRFLARLEARGGDFVPNGILQVAGIDAASGDAACDNSPPLAPQEVTETGELCIVPPCDDGNQCNGTETFDQVLGCVPGTPITCDDGDSCTIDSCDPTVWPGDPCLHAADPGCGASAAVPPALGRSGPMNVEESPSGSCSRNTTCEATARLAYLVAHGFNAVGETIRPVIRIGAGQLNGATLAINRVKFDLDCDAANLSINCPDDGGIVSYQGNLSTDCGVTFTASHFVGDTLPNQVVFTATPTLFLPTDGDSCSIAFDVRLESLSHDITPESIEQVGGLDASTDDAVCTSVPAQSSGAASSARLRICPTCDDEDACTTDVCDPAVGCLHSDQSGSCDDADDCTSDTCDPLSGECVHTPIEGAACSDDDPCTTLDRCVGGACVGGPSVVCNDGNSCTDDACSPTAGCVYTGNGSCTGSLEGQGYWKHLCSQGNDRREFISPVDLACAQGTETFCLRDSIASLCAVWTTSPRDACSRADIRFLSLLMNVCRQRLPLSSTVRSSCGTLRVDELVPRVDRILSEPQRSADDCRSALCLMDGLDDR